MRLLDVHTQQLVSFPANAIPAYAILSHTWDPEGSEVLYRDLIEGNAKNKAGYKKLAGACAVATERGLDYIWIDSCCIDVGNSM